MKPIESTTHEVTMVRAIGCALAASLLVTLIGIGVDPGSSLAAGPSPTPSDSGPSDTTYPSTVTIRYEARSNAFAGRVESPSVRCERGRSVTLRKKRPGQDAVKARAQTNREGKWRALGFSSPNGSWYATVKARTITTSEGDFIRCAGDSSPILQF